MAEGRSNGSKVRLTLARVVWLLCALCASVLAVAALLIAVDAERTNPLVELVLDLADSVDLGVFDLDNPIKRFTGENGGKTTALFNYGIGAVVYLIVGRILDRLVRP
ncbi:hypothetical protein LRP67_10265 [Nocardioides sp. cx-169]|uniref:hypothetical protein n=1 Tax=Nocardioides sp. cx-169 TaxID=2899080 RepID=UPI001E352096|nr:hypothetical protein [Nocardioides sp. cx-169]MCD4534467.1 hypothetical protein [Nocardioides sp. cx-169]